MVRRQHQVHLLRRRRRTVPGQHLAAVAAAAQVGHRAGRVQVQVVAAGLLLVVVIAAAVVQPAEAAGRRRVRQVGHVVQGRVEGVFPERRIIYLLIFCYKLPLLTSNCLIQHCRPLRPFRSGSAAARARS